jgi:5-methylcytosine-specific restriction enzyme subunit McrC
MHVVTLVEHVACPLPREEPSEALAEAVWRRYDKQIKVQPPTFQNGRRWHLICQGYVGCMPLDAETLLVLQPKLPLADLFGMLEYAYRLPFEHPGELIGCGSLQELFGRLASILAQRVLARARRGFYRGYMERVECLPYVRGRLDPRHAPRLSWDPAPACEFQEHTADVVDNRILAWTLHRVARNAAFVDTEVPPRVRRAYRSVQSLCELAPYTAADCVGRLYGRLNDDYAPMHALCRFFLENTGPLHADGERGMLPFLIDTARLFEQFVAAWLQRHLPPTLALRAQEPHVLHGRGRIEMSIDLVVRERSSGRTLAVLDTKYKGDGSPANEDVYQAAFYALAKGCTNAFLLYPREPRPFDVTVQQVRVRSLGFTLDGDLDAGGAAFLDRLLAALGATPR